MIPFLLIFLKHLDLKTIEELEATAQHLRDQALKVGHQLIAAYSRPPGKGSSLIFVLYVLAWTKAGAKGLKDLFSDGIVHPARGLLKRIEDILSER